MMAVDTYMKAGRRNSLAKFMWMNNEQDSESSQHTWYKLERINRWQLRQMWKNGDDRVRLTK